MNKKLILSIAAVFIMTANTFSQSATSITNGNWTNPLTWNCTCVPVNGYSVTVNHTVTLNTSMVFNTGGITINSAGALLQDANRDIWINGGYFNNAGKANFRFYQLSAGSSTNSGDFTVSAVTNSVAFVNSGSLTMDSMYVGGTFTNTSTGKITGDSITNASTFLNQGRVNVNWGTNTGTFNNLNYYGGYAFTNSNVFSNQDSLVMTASLWNRSVFTNSVNAVVKLSENFHNTHPSGTAVFNNNGNVVVLDSWYNTDTVKGSNTGTFTISDSTSNSGYLKGSFKFCDLTAPASAPYIDFHSGTVSPNITWCAPSGLSEKSVYQNISVFPNPSNGNFRISINGQKMNLLITDISGREIKTLSPSDFTGDNCEIRGLAPGVYFISASNFTFKIVVTD